jgi:hypothetical protein
MYEPGCNYRIVIALPMVIVCAVLNSFEMFHVPCGSPFLPLVDALKVV